MMIENDGEKDAGNNLIWPSNITTDRFVMRLLTEQDVTERYAEWLRDMETSRYIISSAVKPNLEELRQYVLQRSNRQDVLFLGIFEKNTRQHIGNIKFEPIDTKLGYAIMGILIGESGWRGKGVAAEVLLGCAEWLRAHRNINQIVLGVSCANTAAITAYQKVGFVEETTQFVPNPSPETVTMVWRLDLLLP